MERKYSNVIRVQQDDWNNPSRYEWVEKIDKAVNDIEGNIVLLGHSCGAVAITQWAAFNACEKIKALILVAPADVDSEIAITPIKNQRPLPLCSLNTKSLLIFSNNDEYLSESRAIYLAKLWGCTTHFIHNAGHIHTNAGFGEWIEGETLFEEFTGFLLLDSRKGTEDVWGYQTVFSCCAPFPYCNILNGIK
nr:alpha/beta hydrolase [Providencia rettgeri]